MAKKRVKRMKLRLGARRTNAAFSARRLAFRPTGIFKVRQIAVPPAVNGANGGYSAGTGSLDTRITTAAATLTSGAFFFRLSDVPQYTTFTALFDQYRIVGISVEFIPSGNVSGVIASGPVYNPTLYVTRDQDDATALTTLTQIRQYPVVKEVGIYKRLKYKFKPKIALAAYGGGVFTSYANMKPQWLDAGNPNVDHYGLKYMTPQPGNAASAQQWSIIIRYDMEFKNVI